MTCLRAICIGARMKGIRMREVFKRLLVEETGATAIEYGLIAGLIAVVIIGALTLTGTSLNSLFEAISGKLSDVADSANG
jgi:pilus assembly protein Flp/PilA